MNDHKKPEDLSAEDLDMAVGGAKLTQEPQMAKDEQRRKLLEKGEARPKQQAEARKKGA